MSMVLTDHLFRSEIDEVGLEMVDHLLAVASKVRLIPLTASLTSSWVN